MKDLVQATVRSDQPRCDHPFAETAQIVCDARLDLAALLANPEDWSPSQWPVSNPADAACLSAAYGKLTDLLAGLTDRIDNGGRKTIASGFQDIRNDLAEIMK